MRTSRHGTRNEYGGYGCRCVECRAEHARAHREWAAKNREHLRKYSRQWDKDNPVKRQAAIDRYHTTEKYRAAQDRKNARARQRRAEQRT